MSSLAEWTAVIDAALAGLGRTDVLVDDAGIAAVGLLAETSRLLSRAPRRCSYTFKFSRTNTAQRGHGGYVALIPNKLPKRCRWARAWPKS